ncbi:hypothetical protein JG688_00010812 [Phytophthora aleatoria]|uniref:AB hydrolase-1 domain-containing protein n=1 Tax=Phytophthora aleatoria TaxID=2496075 RepID=A0A8J5IE27_9STRA|nr:hypothetical protein JG688_00010812 [Phytophthora aleatoria]
MLFSEALTPTHPAPQVLLPSNHLLAPWEKGVEVSRVLAYFIGSLLFLLGSIFFFPKYSVMWNAKAGLFGSWDFVIGCLCFFTGANLDFIQTIRYNHGTPLRQVLRAFTALCNYMATSIFIVGGLYFLPSWYPKAPELGALCFIIGSWFYLPNYINRVDEGTQYMNVAITFYGQYQVKEVKLDPDVGKSTVELTEARGYVAETHNVTTTDGYILTMHRLPKSYDESQAESLADAGYDVWLGNNRGNTYSTNHVKYTTEDDAFWDFSWEDMGRFDLPAMLNYARETSGQKTVAFVGHSEGATQAFVAFSNDQTLAQSVSYFAALAPVAWLGNTDAKALKFLATVYLDKIFEVLGQVEFLSQSEVLQEVIGAAACTANPELCETALALVSGVSENWNSSRVSVYLSEMPAGTSVKNMGHYAQSIRKGTFSAYNYGCGCLGVLGIKLCSKHICENKIKYGSFDPPAFPVGTMKYPRTGFFTGENDN